MSVLSGSIFLQMTLLNGENSKLRQDLHSKEKSHLQMENDL